jgi:hypothetical protein
MLYHYPLEKITRASRTAATHHAAAQPTQALGAQVFLASEDSAGAR